MKTLENILQEITEISEWLKDAPLPKEGAILALRLTELNSYHARLPEIVADAEYLLNAAKAEASNDPVIDYSNKSWNSTRVKNFIESKTNNEQRTYRFAERLNATIVHQIDSVRSQLSYLKSLND